jgi:hypothetical protein
MSRLIRRTASANCRCNCWLTQILKWSGSRDLHPDRLLHRERCCYYTTILIRTGAPGRTRTDEYEFTKLALLLLKAQGLENGALTWICTTNLRLRRAACRANYTLRAIGIEPRLASVIGLAPIRPGLKDRLLDLLCIHGQKMVAAEDENPESLLAGRP